MRVRRATELDVDRIVKLWLAMMDEHQAFDSRIRLTRNAGPSYRSYVSLHLHAPNSLVLVAEDDEGVRGFCCAYICRNLPMFDPPQFGYLSDIFLEPECRDGGTGTALVERTCEWFREKGQTVLQLQVYRNNEVGRTFWHAKGFEPYFDRMWLDL